MRFSFVLTPCTSPRQHSDIEKLFKLYFLNIAAPSLFTRSLPTAPPINMSLIVVKSKYPRWRPVKNKYLYYNITKILYCIL